MYKDISVIIPVYNTEKYLKECLDSVVCQDCESFEVICINDGSTDKSLEVLEIYAEKYKNIYVYTKENGGLSSARNYGLARAQGKYIFFLDSDDMIADKHGLSHMVTNMEEHALDVLYFDGKAFFEDEKVHKSNRGYDSAYQRVRNYGIYDNGPSLFVDFIKQNEYYVSVCLQCMRRAFLVEYKFSFVDKLIYEDQLFTFQSIMLAQRVMHRKECLLNRRVRKGSIMQLEPKFNNFYSMYYIYQEIIHFSRQYMFMPEVNKGIARLLDNLMKSTLALWKKLKDEERVKFYNLPKYEQDLFERIFCAFEQYSDKYCFPYHLFHKGEKVIIYGAGNVGKQFYNDARRDKIVEIVGIVDKNALMMSCDNIPVSTIQALNWMNYDYILIAVENKNVAQEIKKELIHMGVCDKQIKWDGEIYSKNKYYEKGYEYYKFTKRLLKSCKKRIFLFMLPEHGNMGDYAIGIAEQQFFQQYFSDYELVSVTTNEWLELKQFLINSITAEDVLFINGGGFFGDLWKSFEICKGILSSFPQNNKFLFPNTLSYTDITKKDIVMKDLADVLKDKKTYVFWREEYSWDICDKLGFSERCFCFPDMVFNLCFDNIRKVRNDKALLCFRSDKEKTFKDEVNVKQLLEQNNIAYDEKDIHLYKYVPESESEKYIDALLKLFEDYSFIVTDRLHGMLLAYVCETPCIAFDNSTHKIENVYKWIKEEDGVEVLKEYNEKRMQVVIDRYVNEDIEYKLKSKMKEPFYKMAETIKGIVEVQGKADEKM